MPKMEELGQHVTRIIRHNESARVVNQLLGLLCDLVVIKLQVYTFLKFNSSI